MRATGVAILVGAGVLAGLGPFLAPHDPGEQFREFAFAPPMRIRMVDAEGRWRRPFVYPLRVADRIERRYEEDRRHPVPLVWGRSGRLVQTAAEPAVPLLVLGADSVGRDVFARLVIGARVSLGVGALALLGALALGVLAGGVAGYMGGRVDAALMRLADFVLVLPALYVVLALRTALPLVLPTPAIFLITAGLLAFVGWPYVARGVRAIVAAEGACQYVEAARSVGAGPVRVLVRHLVPATGGFLATQTVLLFPAFILAETTLSYVGLGFPDEVPSWGALLQEAADVRALATAPWLASPAAALILISFALHLAGRLDRRGDLLAAQSVFDRRVRATPAPGAR